MVVNNTFALPRPKLSMKDFSRISQFIQNEYGIKLPVEKLVLVESRLMKRIAQLNLKSFSEYVSLVFSSEGKDEQDALIDYISTNKTEFFRENHHFKFLENHIRLNKVAKPLQIWSAACSSGEEPYSISIVLEELKSKINLPVSHSILATDISNTILTKAIRGEYPEKGLEGVSKEIAQKYFRVNNGIATINASVRKAISFRKFNLIDDLPYRHLGNKFDIIFCRNVLIYFDQATQQRVITNLINQLQPGGFILLGHSETLLNRNFNITQIQPTVYQKSHA